MGITSKIWGGGIVLYFDYSRGYIMLLKRMNFSMYKFKNKCKKGYGVVLVRLQYI